MSTVIDLPKSGTRGAQRAALAEKEATTQMNVRMSKRLHEAGVEAFASIGISPSEAVRALWVKAAKRGEDLAEVRRMLAEGADQSDVDGRAAAVRAGQQIVNRGAAALGLSTASWPLEGFPSYDEIAEEARLESLVRAGALDG